MNRNALRMACRGLPIFPLPKTVLFPHALLPLQVTEPRYRALVADCLAQAPRPLAVPELKDDAEATSSTAPFYPFTGVGLIGAHQALPDGRANLLVQGLARVRIERELPASNRLYRMVEAEVLDDRVVPEAELVAQGEHLRALFASLIGRICDRMGQGGQKLARAMMSLPAARIPDALAHVTIRDQAARQVWFAEDDPRLRASMVESAVLTLFAQSIRPLETDA